MFVRRIVSCGVFIISYNWGFQLVNPIRFQEVTYFNSAEGGSLAAEIPK